MSEFTTTRTLGVPLTPAPGGTTRSAYAVDIDESMQAAATESIDEVLGRVREALAGTA